VCACGCVWSMFYQNSLTIFQNNYAQFPISLRFYVLLISLHLGRIKLFFIFSSIKILWLDISWTKIHIYYGHWFNMLEDRNCLKDMRTIPVSFHFPWPGASTHCVAYREAALGQSKKKWQNMMYLSEISGEERGSCLSNSTIKISRQLACCKKSTVF